MKIKKINALTHIITFIPSIIVMPIDIAMYLMKERSKFNHKMHKSELLSREYKYIWINLTKNIWLLDLTKQQQALFMRYFLKIT